MQHSFQTIEDEGEDLYKEKGSKFFAHAYPVSSEEAVKAHLEALKKKYHDARHHCYAFVLFAHPEVIRYSDAGEPSNSAGQPILRQIRSFGLVNTLVVVVRYFGGTKLGVGGLVSAYGESARLALSKATTKEVTIYRAASIAFDPQHIHLAMQLIQGCGAEIQQEDFVDGRSVYVLQVPLAQLPDYEKGLATYYQIKSLD